MMTYMSQSGMERSALRRSSLSIYQKSMTMVEAKVQIMMMMIVMMIMMITILVAMMMIIMMMMMMIQGPAQ